MGAAAAEVGCDEQRAILTDDSLPCYRGPESEGPNVTEEQKESKPSQIAHKQVKEIHHAPVTSRLPFAPDHGAAAVHHPQPGRAGHMAGLAVMKKVHAALRRGVHTGRRPLETRHGVAGSSSSWPG